MYSFAPDVYEFILRKKTYFHLVEDCGWDKQIRYYLDPASTNLN